MTKTKFSKKSEQFMFMSALSQLSSTAVHSVHKELYLNVGIIILQELKNHSSYNDMIQPLNDFYKIMEKYWNARSDEEWQQFISEVDCYTDKLPEKQQSFMQKCFMELLDEVNRKCKRGDVA